MTLAGAAYKFENSRYRVSLLQETLSFENVYVICFEQVISLGKRKIAIKCFQVRLCADVPPPFF